MSWASAGGLGFRSANLRRLPRKRCRHGTKATMEHGMKSMEVYEGPRFPAVKALSAPAGDRPCTEHDRDVTPIPHNGCRPPKRRRV